MNDTANRLAGSILDDYATRPVPEENRISGVTQGCVWAGGTFCASRFSIGGMLAASLTPTAFLAAALTGIALVSVVTFLIGRIGAKTHLSSAFNARFALGTEGGKLFGIILALSLSGWFGWQCAYFADSTIATLKMFGLTGGSPAVWAVVGGLLMMLPAMAGFQGITILSNIGAPLLFMLALIAAGITAGQADLSALAEAAAGGISLTEGIGLVVGSIITGACIMPDLSRFSRHTGDAAVTSILGFLIAPSAVLLLGGFFYYAYGTSDPCEVLISYCGLGMFVPFVLVVSIWTTNDLNIYSAVLGVSNALDDHVRLPRWRLTLVMGAVSTLLGALGILEMFTSFLNLLGALIPPVAAVIIADFYLYNRSSGLYAYENAGKLPNFRTDTCLSAVAGIAVGLLCNYSSIRFFSTLCSVLPACIWAMLTSMASLVICSAAARSRSAGAV